MRATAEVVAIVEPSRRRGALVGVLREEPGGGLLFLLPADPRLPRCFVRPADLPPILKRELKVMSLHYLHPWYVPACYLSCLTFIIFL